MLSLKEFQVDIRRKKNTRDCKTNQFLAMLKNLQH